MGEAICAQCGQPAGPVMPPVPGLEYEVQAYAGKVKALASCWLIYAGLALVVGVAGLHFARLLLNGTFAPWIDMHDSPMWLTPALLHFAWVTIAVRCVLAAVAGWGLWERAPWGRVVAIVAAILSLLKFPFGTALGIWTLVTLAGYRNATLYDQMPRD